MAKHINLLVIAVVAILTAHEASAQQNTTAGPKYSIDTSCRLKVQNENDIRHKIQTYIKKGKLIEYTITFSAGTENDINDVIVSNGTDNYKILEWKRVFSRHGQALLSVPFNYKILSMSLLSYGVMAIDIQLQETPTGCFANLDPEQQLNTVRELTMYDFQLPTNENEKYLQEGNFACHKIVRNDDGIAEFVYKCCTLTKRSKSMYCEDHIKGRWFQVLFSVIPWMDVAFFLFFPLFALGVISRRSYRTTNYIVKLKEPHVATIKKALTSMEMMDISKTPKKQLESKPILGKKSKKLNNAGGTKRQCIDNVRKLPWNRPLKVQLPLLHILVDHKQLMAENDVNIGFRQFIWTNLFLCGLRKDFPFVFCCRQSILGSWKKKFFCWPIPQRYGFVRTMRRLNAKYRRYLSWQNVFALLSFLTIVALIPLPYYIEIIIFKNFNEQEVADRQEAAKVLGLSINPPPYLPYNYFLPFIPVHVTALVVYFVTSLVMLVLYQMNSFNFIEYLVAILRDFKHLERIETLRMLALQLTTPFEKFGILGLFIGPFMWIITIPFGILTIVYYCVPTVYLLGRLWFLHKPNLVQKLMCHKKTHSDRYNANLKEEKKMREDGMKPEDDSDNEEDLDNLEKILLLQRISPQSEDFLPIRPLKKDGTLKPITVVGYTDCQKIVLGIVLSLWMISLLVLYSDFFGFALEILTLTFMGAIANAGSVGQYFFFTFFIVTYTRTVLNKVNEKYQQMSSELFSHIKSKLDEDLSETVILRGTEQKNFAFKFFSKAELRELNENRQLSIVSDVETGFADIYKDKFQTMNKKLHLRLHSVILFLDKHDKPRIPKQLFDEICQIKCPGCPGPIYKSLLLAIKELGYLILFLFFVLVVVMAFGDAYEISTTNQLLMTVVGGFAPFVVRFVMKPKSLHVNFSTYSFKGKVHEIISAYMQSWPVYDIEFEFVDDSEDSNKTSTTKNTAESINEQSAANETGDKEETVNNVDKNTEVKPIALTDNSAIEVGEDEISLVENNPDMARPKPRRQMSAGRNNNIEADVPVNRKANLFKLDTVSDGVDLVFHMRTIPDDQEENDLFVMNQ